MGLKNEQLLRDIAGTIWLTYLGLGSHPVFDAGLCAGKRYHEAVTEQKDKPQEERVDLGAPYIHVWLAIVQSLMISPGLPVLLKTLLTKYHDDYLCTASQEEVANTVRYCRLKSGYKEKDSAKQTYKLTWAVSYMEVSAKDPENLATNAPLVTRSLESVVCAAMSHAKLTRKIGSAPRSEMERVAQRYLDKLK